MYRQYTTKADNLLRELFRRKLTTREAARLAGINYALFCALLSTDREVTTKTALRLREAFGEGVAEKNFGERVTKSV